MKAACALAAALNLCAALASGQDGREPHVGYLYPAGGQRGALVQVLAGGQSLGGVKGVHVSGGGVQVSVVRYMGRIVRLNGDERRELARRLKALKPAEGSAPPDAMAGAREEPTVDLPKHPLLDDLDGLSAVEMDFVVNELLKPDSRRQPNNPLSETVLLEVAIDADAAPGARELRLVTRTGLANPVRFEVGRAPELLEPQPYDASATPAPPVDLPIVLNGQIRPGDVDRFRIRANEGQQLVIETRARRLTPFLADAVPGWFQATLALFDAKGNGVAYADDYRFDPDPVLRVRIPATGVYELEIRDALDRGREDFVYRVALGEQPFVTSLFPLGGRAGEPTVAELEGWNLPADRLQLDTQPGGEPVRVTALSGEDWSSNALSYAVDTLPEIAEVEPDDSDAVAQHVELPTIVNGRIATGGDEDVYRFDGRAGAEVVCAVLARGLQSPLDSLLRLTDAAGEVVAWNDDCESRDGMLRTDVGELTHHADSYLRAKLPRAGAFFVHVSDAQRQGGAAWSYRLRISAPRPDFRLSVTPSTVNARAGGATLITARALRIDGFAGEIELALKDAPPGFALQGARIPAGCDSVRLTLSAPAEGPAQPVALQLEGRANAGAATLVHAAVPVEDMMQAFLWRHLVPSREWVVAVVATGARNALAEVAHELPVVVPAGGTVEVLIRTKVRAENVQLELDAPPAGVTLQQVLPARNGLRLVLGADAAVEPALAGNLIVAAYTEFTPKDKQGKATGQKRRVRAGVLPAIPFRVGK